MQYLPEKNTMLKMCCADISNKHLYTNIFHCTCQITEMKVPKTILHFAIVDTVIEWIFLLLNIAV